jgi:hypothetical protein
MALSQRVFFCSGRGMMCGQTVSVCAVIVELGAAVISAPVELFSMASSQPVF